MSEWLELADAHGSDPCARKGVGVRISPWTRKNMGISPSQAYGTALLMRGVTPTQVRILQSPRTIKGRPADGWRRPPSRKRVGSANTGPWGFDPLSLRARYDMGEQRSRFSQFPDKEKVGGSIPPSPTVR